MFAQITKQWFWDYYDHLGRLILGNIIAFLALVPPLYICFVYLEAVLAPLSPQAAVLTLFVATVTVLPPFAALWFSSFGHFGGRVSLEKDPRLGEFVVGLRRRFLKMWRFFLLLFGLLGLLWLNMWFYVAGGFLPEGLRLVGYLLAGVCFWLSILVVIAAIPALPAVVRTDLSVMASWRFGLLCLLRYPGVLTGVFIFLCSLWVIGFFLRLAGIFLFAFAGTALLFNSTYDVLVAFEEGREKAAKGGAPRPRTWRERREAESESEEERMNRVRYERTLRDVLRPWEM